jgi:hypothetical protein
MSAQRFCVPRPHGSTGNLPRAAASDSWRSLRVARVPPVDYGDGLRCN